jgi:hypothetical protein
MVGRNNGKDDGEGARLGGSAAGAEHMGGVSPLHVGRQIEQHKKYKKMSWPQMAMLQYFTCNNKPKTCGRDKGDVGEEEQPEGGCAGGCYSILLVAIKRQ